MDSLDNDVYEYDKSLFFKLLESKRFSSTFESIQEQQGVVICPIEIKNRPYNSNDLIEKHLFVPSPFYKNHFIPLFYAMSSNRKSSTGSRVSATPESSVNLIVKATSSPRIELTCDGKPICTDTKLLKTETAYSAGNSRPYRILVVDRELTYGVSRPPDEPTTSIYDNDSEEGLLSTDLVAAAAVNDNDEEEFNGNGVLMVSKNRDSIAKRGSSISLSTGFIGLKDVNTFVKAIDYLHNTVCVVEESSANSSANAGTPTSRRRNELAKNNGHQQKRLVKVRKSRIFH